MARRSWRAEEENEVEVEVKDDETRAGWACLWTGQASSSQQYKVVHYTQQLPVYACLLASVYKSQLCLFSGRLTENTARP